jgi:HEAT repeat protein
MRLFTSNTDSVSLLSAIGLVAIVASAPWRLVYGDQLLTDRTGACADVRDCLNVLDDWEKTYNGRVEDVTAAVSNLKRFGVPMRRALLERAVGADFRSRQLADLLLNAWDGWTQDDVPELAKVLAANHGGMIAHALGKIGTPKAIEALVNDLRPGDPGQSDYVLSKIGPPAVPFLFPLLGDPDLADPAARVITSMGRAAVSFADGWSRLALDSGQPIKVRVGALRGIAALGSAARASTDRLHPLLAAPETELRSAVGQTLLAVGDPAGIQAIAAKCHPEAAPMDYYGWLPSTACLQDLQRFGSDAAVAGPQVLPFLQSKNSDERLMGAITFGVIHFRPASFYLREALNDPDWRVVYAAARALGRLRAAEATPDLRAVANTHWLPEVRRIANASLEAMEVPPNMPTPALEPSKRTIFYSGSGHADYVDTYVLDEVPPCAQRLWQWQSIEFGFSKSRRTPDSYTITARIKKPPGLLTGVNRGEFGGGLVWHPDAGSSVDLFKDLGVSGVEPDDDGAVFISGLNHMGFNFGIAGALDRTAGAHWNLRELPTCREKLRIWTLLVQASSPRGAGRGLLYSTINAYWG